MKTEGLIDLISDHLQEANSNKEERLKRIDEMLAFLNYNKRLTELSDEEKQDFIYCNEGFPWTEEMRTTYDNAPNQKTKDHYIDMWSRSTYFRLCAWHNYLFGHTEDKPFIKEAEKKVA